MEENAKKEYEPPEMECLIFDTEEVTFGSTSYIPV